MHNPDPIDPNTTQNLTQSTINSSWPFPFLPHPTSTVIEQLIDGTLVFYTCEDEAFTNMLEPAYYVIGTYITSNQDSLNGTLARRSEPNTEVAHFHCADFTRPEQTWSEPDYLSYMYIHNY